MLKKCLFVSLLIGGCAAIASAQDAKTALGNVSRSLGADALKTVQYSATGFDYALGQNPNASAPWPKFIEKSYTRAIDFEGKTSRVDRVRLVRRPERGRSDPIATQELHLQISHSILNAVQRGKRRAPKLAGRIHDKWGAFGPMSAQRDRNLADRIHPPAPR